MYDQSFRNQAVKECVNGQSLRGTAIKYGIAETTLRIWIVEYRERMVEISGLKQETVPAILGADMPHKEEAVVEESVVVLNSVNIAVDGHDITISKRDVVRLMEVFYHFDKKEGKRDDVWIWERKAKKGYGGSLIITLTPPIRYLGRLTIIVMETSR